MRYVYILALLILASCTTPAEAQWRVHHTQRQIAAHWQAAQPAALMTAHWEGDVLVVAITHAGCLRSQPDDTGIGACDFSGNPWEARIWRYGNQAGAAGVSGRSYELESGGEIVGTLIPPPYAFAWLPDIAR